MDISKTQKQLKPLLYPLGASYAALMRLRRKLYAAKACASFTPSIPCISIGNIAWGGTGKTPFIDWMLSWAETNSIRTTVLTRGYGGNTGKSPVVVTASTSPERAGDEPVMLARNHPASQVIAFPKRVTSAKLALQQYNPQLFLLDDGMQHLAINRNTNIVLLRPEDLTTEWNTVIPAGSWREDKSALAYASAFAIKISPEYVGDFTHTIIAKLSTYKVPVFTFYLAPLQFIPLHQYYDAPSATALPLYTTALQHKPYTLVTGVGNPKQVTQTATQALLCPPTRELVYPDHYNFTQQDIAAMQHPGGTIICTEKDAVKLTAFAKHFANSPIYVMKTQLAFGQEFFSNCNFATWITQEWQKLSATDHNHAPVQSTL